MIFCKVALKSATGNKFDLTWTHPDGVVSPQEQLMSVSLMKPQG